MAVDPLLATGPLREETASLLERLVAYLFAERRDHWSDGGDADVPPSLLLLAAYLHAHRPDLLPRATAIALQEEAAALLGERMLPPYLLGGFVQIAWTLEHAARVAGLEEFDLEEIDTALLRYLEREPWDTHFDLIAGLAGVGVYGAERATQATGRELLARVVRHLEALARPEGAGVAWYSPARLLPAWQREYAPDGYYNVGVAHGVPGVLGALSLAVEVGVDAAAARELLDGGMRWLLEQRSAPGETSVFPDQIIAGTPRQASRLAWCYGDAGVMLVMLAAARRAAEPAWEAAARDVVHRAADRDPATAAVLDVPVCHGSAGLAHLFHRAWSATGDERAGRAALFWLDQALERHRWEGMPGLRSHRQDGDRILHDLLNGLPGIALVLLSFLEPAAMGWDRILLADVPAGETGSGER